MYLDSVIYSLLKYVIPSFNSSGRALFASSALQIPANFSSYDDFGTG